MWTSVKTKTWLIGAFFFLSSFAQKDTSLLIQGSSSQIVSSKIKNDKLLIKYIPVVPKSFQFYDAWFIQSNHNYSIDSNKGYGAKKHIEGIKEHGITIWHRKTFGICSNPLLKKVEPN